ncbi:hypothetical protein EI94DRAFT_1791385 [Lactarius quietus]|nr:hypothetical protein EI94DRAFT_1791385 [Lactarius quietus]
MYAQPYPHYTGTYRPYQCPPLPAEPPALPSMSTIALQDIVQGQQQATNGLVTLLSNERTTAETNTREHKQQLANLTSLSSNFLSFMPDVEQKFLALESSIRSNCSNPENADLQARVKDMVEVVANLGRIAEGFACSTGLRLVPNLAPNPPWAWVQANNAQPLQQDPTSFSASFTQAPRLFPAAIPNSSRSSVFAHSTGPARSVHWPSDLDVPSSSWGAPLPDPCGNFPVNFCGLRNSRSSLSCGTRPSVYAPHPPFHYAPTVSDQSLPPSSPVPGGGQYRPFMSPCRSPSPSMTPPILRPSSPLTPVPHSPPTLSCSRTESVVGSIRRTSLSPITERTSPSSAVPPPPAFGRTPANGPSPSTSSVETFSTPSHVMLNPPSVPQSRFSVSTAPRSDSVVAQQSGGQMPPNWFDMVYPRYSPPSISSADDYTIPSPTSVEVPNLRPGADNVRWSSLFPSAPIVVERPTECNLLLRTGTPEESVSSPMSSPARSVISYGTKSSIPSEPMTPVSGVSGELVPAPNKPTTDNVDTPKSASPDTVVLSTPTLPSATATASTSTAITPSPARNPLAIQLVSFFFDTIQRLYKVPTTVDLSYGGFEVTFKTDSIAWTSALHDALQSMRDADADADGDRRMFEIMPAPANAALHRYIKDLARVRMDLAALSEEDTAVAQLALRVVAEQETAQGWMRRVCETAGALSIAYPTFSPRK